MYQLLLPLSVEKSKSTEQPQDVQEFRGAGFTPGLASLRILECVLVPRTLALLDPFQWKVMNISQGYSLLIFKTDIKLSLAGVHGPHCSKILKGTLFFFSQASNHNSLDQAFWYRLEVHIYTPVSHAGVKTARLAVWKSLNWTLTLKNPWLFLRKTHKSIISTSAVVHASRIEQYKSTPWQYFLYKSNLIGEIDLLWWCWYHRSLSLPDLCLPEATFACLW